MFSIGFSEKQVERIVWWRPRTRGIRYYIIHVARTDEMDVLCLIVRKHGKYTYKSDLDTMLRIVAMNIVRVENDMNYATCLPSMLIGMIEAKCRFRVYAKEFIRLYKKYR